MLTREECKRTITRIFDSVRADEEFLGECHCDGTQACSECPFEGMDMFCLDELSIDNIFNAFEYIEKWAEEHPLVTMRDKYKEVFGVEPVLANGGLVCPADVGLSHCNCINKDTCSDCKATFWDSEYKPIRQGGEQNGNR